MKFKSKIATLLILVLMSIWATVGFASSQGTSSTTAGTIVDRAEVWLNDSDNRFWSAGELLQWLNEGMIDIVSRSHCLEATETVFLDTNTIEYTVSSTYLTVKAVQYVDASHNSWALKKGSPASVGQNTAVTIPTYWYDWGGKVGIYPALTSLANSSNTFAISGAVTNGGLIRITSAVHGFTTGDTVTIAAVGGTTEANDDWTITVISTTVFDLVGSTFANAYTSGGTVFETETVKLYYVTRPTAIATGTAVTTPAIYDTALTMYMVAQAWLKDLKMNKYLQTMGLYNAEMNRIRQDLNQFPPQVIE
jgi:hypothetical protein